MFVGEHGYFTGTPTRCRGSGKISNDEPLETLANILEAIIDTILYGSTGVKTEKLSSFAATP